jgi:hypothetical protein
MRQMDPMPLPGFGARLLPVRGAISRLDARVLGDIQDSTVRSSPPVSSKLRRKDAASRRGDAHCHEQHHGQRFVVAGTGGDARMHGYPRRELHRGQPGPGEDRRLIMR